MKLAVFTGQYFWFDGKHYSTDEAFIKFVTSFCTYFEKIIFCDAVAKEVKKEAYILDPTNTEVCPLPYFSVYSFWKNVLVIYPKIYRIIRRNIHQWDIFWLPSPHPISLLIAHICRKFDKPFFLFIRQNFRIYLALRNRGGKRIVAILFAIMLEYVFRRLSRRTLTFVVGGEMFEIYRSSGAKVYETAVSLISDEHIACGVRKLTPDDSVQVRLLSVGRLDPEKGVTYLIEAMDMLVASGKKNIILQLVGKGSEEKRLRWEVNRRGLAQHILFFGYIRNGHQLLDLYRKSDIFVLPSLTEGWPQTLFEAMACGVPIIATKVGGIPYLIKDGLNGLLIDPASPMAIFEGISRLIEDRRFRNRLIKNGLRTVKSHTLEAERDRIMSRIQDILAATSS